MAVDYFRLSCAGIAIAGVLVAAQARADVYVDAAAASGGNGQMATPFRTLHEAYATVTDNTAVIVRVAGGNYVDNVGSAVDLYGKNRQYTFLGGYQPGFASRDPNTYPTTATAADATRPVFWFYNTSAVTIDGFNITNGKSGVIIGGWASGRTAAVTHCHVFANGHFSGTYDDGKLSDGGGVWLSGLTVTLSDSVIENNHSASFGGGVYVQNADDITKSVATVERNAIRSNTAHGGQAHGGGVYFSVSGAVRDNLIDGNATDNPQNGGAGGGIIVLGTGVVATLERNWISHNVALTGGGGVIIDENATATLINNVIVRNKAGRSGSGVDVDQGSTPSHAILVNNTIAFNTGVPGVQVYNSTIDMINNIVWGHTAGDLNVDATQGGTFNVSYSTFSTQSTGVTVGAGNLKNDPAFVNAAADDYHLTGASPLNDHGTASGAPAVDYAQNPRPQGAGIDIGAYEQAGAGSRDGGTPWPPTPDAGGTGGGTGGTTPGTGGTLGGTGGTTSGVGGTGGRASGAGGTGGTTSGAGGTGGTTSGVGGTAAGAGGTSSGSAGAGDPTVDAGHSPNVSGNPEVVAGPVTGACSCTTQGRGEVGRGSLVLGLVMICGFRRRRRRS